jgi:hypothetical protein
LFHIKLFPESTENTEVILPGFAFGVKFAYDVPESVILELAISSRFVKLRTRKINNYLATIQLAKVQGPRPAFRALKKTRTATACLHGCPADFQQKLEI